MPQRRRGFTRAALSQTPVRRAKASSQITVLGKERMLRMRKLVSLCLLLVSVGWGQETRHFRFHYGFTVKDLPAAERVRIWIPAAHSDDFQEIKVISAT